MKPTSSETTPSTAAQISSALKLTKGTTTPRIERLSNIEFKEQTHAFFFLFLRYFADSLASL
jgi:hypothetical protein